MPEINPITSSPNDQKNYRSLTLSNGLQVLLINDPEAEKAAASMNVAAGSLHEPDTWPGLAHFLEHMLFLGSETYPEPDAYQNFIRQHGGSYNAFTAPRDTNYFFDIRPEHLEGALSRFSRFFIDPLISPEYLEREVNAVHSEWSATLQDDGRRQLSALRQALNPEHPSSRFSAGNRDSLDISNPQLREAMLGYHQDFYQADRMSLVVLGPQSLNELQQLTEGYFASIAAGSSQAEPSWPELISADQLPAKLSIQPLRQERKLQLLFPIPDSTSDFTKKPDRFLAQLIGHEGEGSLLDQLKQQGWATHLSAGTQMRTGEEALFTISLQLTEVGEQHLDEIQTAIFDWLKLIQQQGVEEWRFQEAQQLAKYAFRFQERSDPSRLVTHLAMQMPRYPLHDLLRVHYAWDEFDAELIHSYLELLTPDRRLVIHSSPDVETDQVAPWVAAHYRLQQPLSTEQAQLPPLSVKLNLQLPSANPFLPSSLEVLDAAPNTQPVQLESFQGMEVWQGLDTSFAVPRNQLYISLQNPGVAEQLEQRLLADLAARWLNEQLNAPAYPARIAGLDYQVYASSRGLTFLLSGYNAEQPRLANKMLNLFLQGDVEPEQFQRLATRLQQDLDNQKRDRLPQQLVRELFNQLTTPSWSHEQKQRALAQLTHQDLESFIQEFTSELYIQVLSWGNMPKDSIKELANDLQQALKPQLNREAVALTQVRQLPPGQWNQQLKLEHNDRAFLGYLQGQASLKDEALFRLLTQLQASAFFHELRTEQQLGYAVFTSYLPLLQQPGLFYFIQSPEVEPEQLAEATEAFMRSDLKRIENMSAADFAQHQQSLIQRLMENDQRLSQRAERFWREIGHQRYAFQHQEQLAEQVQTLDQQAFVEFYRQILDLKRGFYLLGSTPTPNKNLPGQAAEASQWSSQ